MESTACVNEIGEAVKVPANRAIAIVVAVLIVYSLGVFEVKSTSELDPDFDFRFNCQVGKFTYFSSAHNEK